MNKLYIIILSLSLPFSIGLRAYPSSPRKNLVSRITRNRESQHPEHQKERYPQLNKHMYLHEIFAQYTRAIDWYQQEISCTAILTPESFFPYNKSHLSGWSKRILN